MTTGNAEYDSIANQINEVLIPNYTATPTTNTYSQQDGSLIPHSVLITPGDEDNDNFFEVYRTDRVWHGASHGPGYSRKLTANTLHEVLNQFGLIDHFSTPAEKSARRRAAQFLLVMMISSAFGSGLTSMYLGNLGVGLVTIAIGFVLSLICKLM